MFLYLGMYVIYSYRNELVQQSVSADTSNTPTTDEA